MKSMFFCALTLSLCIDLPAQDNDTLHKEVVFAMPRVSLWSRDFSFNEYFVYGLQSRIDLFFDASLNLYVCYPWETIYSFDRFPEIDTCIISHQLPRHPETISKSYDSLHHHRNLYADPYWYTRFVKVKNYRKADKAFKKGVGPFMQFDFFKLSVIYKPCKVYMDNRQPVNILEPEQNVFNRRYVIRRSQRAIYRRYLKDRELVAIKKDSLNCNCITSIDYSFFELVNPDTLILPKEFLTYEKMKSYKRLSKKMARYINIGRYYWRQKHY